MSKLALLPDVFTADEAARFLRVSKATLLRLASQGLVLGVKIGRQWRFPKETILTAHSKHEDKRRIPYTNN